MSSELRKVSIDRRPLSRMRDAACQGSCLNRVPSLLFGALNGSLMCDPFLPSPALFSPEFQVLGHTWPRRGDLQIVRVEAGIRDQFCRFPQQARVRAKPSLGPQTLPPRSAPAGSRRVASVIGQHVTLDKYRRARRSFAQGDSVTRLL